MAGKVEVEVHPQMPTLLPVKLKIKLIRKVSRWWQWDFNSQQGKAERNCPDTIWHQRQSQQWQNWLLDLSFPLLYCNGRLSCTIMFQNGIILACVCGFIAWDKKDYRKIIELTTQVTIITYMVYIFYWLLITSSDYEVRPISQVETEK
jgi:hypothetical protein